jgi:hypothetical protein
VYGFLADVLVGIHVAYVLFVVLGLVAIVVGACLRWQWSRNPWFRCIHLLMITIVAVEAIFNIKCPLTDWEDQLRHLAGQPFEGESFIGRMMHQLIMWHFPMWVFNTIYICFALLVASTFWFAPVRWRKKPASVEQPQELASPSSSTP